MIRIVAVAVVLHAAMARAEPATDVAKRLVDFAHGACDLMAKQGPRPTSSSEPRLAAHFGRIVKSVDKNEGGLRYFLAVPQLAGWKVEYHLRKFRLHPPSDLRLSVQELVNLLGDVNYAPVEDPPSVRNDWAFALPRGWGSCYLEVYTDLQGEDVHRQHVLAFHFGQPGPT
jgi:hypothetical protein